MKRTINKVRIYEIVYDVLQFTLYFGVVCVGIAYFIFLMVGREKHILLNVEITLMFAVFLLGRADVLIGKKLYKGSSDIKRNKAHTVAFCVSLAGGTLCGVTYAVISFCDISGVFALTIAVVGIMSAIVTAVALAVEYFVNRKIKAEKTNGKNSDDGSGNEPNAEGQTKEANE